MWHGNFTAFIIVATVLGFLFGFAALIANNARRKKEIDLMRLAIEKGQELPEFPFPRVSRYGPLKAALVWIAIGIGLMLMVLIEEFFGWSGAAIGFIPLLIGLALLIGWNIEKKDEGKAAS